MSACVICRPLARRLLPRWGTPRERLLPLWGTPRERLLPRWGTPLERLLHWAHGHTEAEADEKEQEAAVHPGRYWLHYNPTVYRHPQRTRDAAAMDTGVPEDGAGPGCGAGAGPSFRQQVNRYTVSSSRHLCSAKHKVLDLAFNRASGDRTQARSSQDHHRNIDPRAFQRCRPEYASMTLDLSQRPPAIQSKQPLLLLHKVSLLKDRLNVADVVRFLQELGRLHQEQTSLVRSNTSFAALLRYLVENLEQFSGPQLLQALESFVWLDLPSAHCVLGSLEAELMRRASRMSLQQLLLAADLWRCLRRKVPGFLEQLYGSVNPSQRHIGVAELVQLVYIIGEGRHCPKYLAGPVELILMRHLDELKPEEVGTVCLGLFKSQTSLSPRSVSRLIDRAHAVVEEMSDFAVVNVFKLLRFSHLDHKAWLEVMSEEVPRRVPGMDAKGLMHVALACSSLHYRSDSILGAVAQKLPSVAPQCRSKDCCKLLWSFGALGVAPSQRPELYACLVDAMRQRKAEFQRYPEHLFTGLLGLAFAAQFPEDLLALALSPEYVGQALKRTQGLINDVFTLDGTVGLELPHWTGPRLDAGPREEAAERLWRFAQSDVCQKAEVLEAEQLLQELLGGKQFVRKGMILPHTRSIDLEVHLDSTGTPLALNSCPETAAIPKRRACRSHDTLSAMVGVRLTEDLLTQMVPSKKNMHSPLSPQPQPPALRRLEADDGERQSNVDMEVDKAPVRLAVQVTNRNHHCYQSEQLMGLHALKRRQLRLAGYRVVELYHWEWFPLLRKRMDEKLAYLHCKIYSSVD